ncbi:hypothetical protein D9M71_833170 [compost metagenome]
MPVISPADAAAPCRSELAREKPGHAAFIQTARVIVNDLREQARSYRVRVVSDIAQTTAESAESADYSAATTQSPDRTSTRPRE